MTDLTVSSALPGALTGSYDLDRNNARSSLAEVNPFSLIEAVNDTSEIAHTGWLIFLGVVAYFCIAAAGVSHKDLLLNSAVQLPFMQVSIDLTRFFLFAPVVLLFMHFGLLVQHVMLARKVMEFDAAVRAMEPSARRTHPIRHELNSYFFTQALAGPERSALFGGFLHGMFWLSIIGVPVMVILFIQIVYLPYHDVTTTWSHRLALVLDTVLLALMGVFLGSRSTSFFGAFSRMLSNQPLNFMFTALLYVCVLFFSFFIATVPDEGLDKVMQSLPGSVVKTASAADGDIQKRRVFAVTDYFFEGLGHTSLFRRNISVTDETIVDRDARTGALGTVSLRDRDLRFAELDRSNLQNVDFTGADLTGARMVGASLTGAKLSCLDIDTVLTEPKLRSTSCAILTSADLTRADLTGADLRLAYLDGATLENAILARTDLRYANMIGSNFSGADMRGALMGGGVDLTGANFLGANLSGADLKGAKIQAADFYGADLQAARLVFAQAQGANFQGAKLQGASLGAAKLQGADLSDADVSAADFGNATVWVSKPPSTGLSSLADYSAINIKALEAKDLTVLKDLRKGLKQPKVAEKIGKLIERIGTTTSGAEWNAGDEATGWAGLKQASLTSDAAARTEKTATYLARLACESAHSDGTVAAGVIRRAVDQPTRASPGVLMKRLKGQECPAFKHLPEPLVLSLAAVIEKTTPVVQEAVAETAPSAPAASTTAASTTEAATPSTP
jgi:uncharacterized protein YjbI with pentapeptide repeats